MSKKPHGHYCRICGQYKANEKFSGRGHAAHICKACAKRGNKPPEIKIEPLIYVDIDTVDINIDSPAIAVEDKPLKPKRKRKPSKEKLLRAAQKKTAKAMLSDILANGEVSVEKIKEAAFKEGIKTESLRRAKGSLGIRTITSDSGNVWRLPNQNTLADVR